MTEDEAKKKWCPIMWKNIVTNGVDSFAAGSANCRASVCMMWRQTDNECKPEFPGDAQAKSLPSGYCGLGG